MLARPTTAPAAMDVGAMHHVLTLRASHARGRSCEEAQAKGYTCTEAKEAGCAAPAPPLRHALWRHALAPRSHLGIHAPRQKSPATPAPRRSRPGTRAPRCGARDFPARRPRPPAAPLRRSGRRATPARK
eukprot:4162002-Prymnesium_polylepis.1